MALGRPAIQQRRPLRCQLSVQQSLRHPEILDPRETVVLLLVSQAGIGHLPSQPVPAVESHMHREREPALEPRVPQAVVRIQIVMVVVKAFTRLDPYLQLLGLPVAPHLNGLARLDAAQHRDQPSVAPVFGGQPQRRLFLALLAVVEILVDAGLLGFGLDGLAQFHRRLLGERLVVLERHLRLRQKTRYAARIAQQPFAAAKTKPVKTMQDTQD